MDLVIGVGFIFTDDVTQLAKEYPNINFAVVDYAIATDKAGRPIAPPSNVAALKFKEEEGSFLVGAIAALVSQSKKVGFVGGMDVPLIQKFEAGYKAGVKSVCAICSVISQYAGVTPDRVPQSRQRAKSSRSSQYQQGVDVIYHASGSTGLGVFEAARQTGKYAIGVDADQYGEAPGRVLTSMVKGIDVAVFDMVKRVRDKTFYGGIYTYGLRAERRRVRVRRAQSRAHPRQRARPRRAAQGGHHRREDPRAQHEMSIAELSLSLPIAIRLTDIHKSFGPVHANRGASHPGRARRDPRARRREWRRQIDAHANPRRACTRRIQDDGGERPRRHRMDDRRRRSTPASAWCISTSCSCPRSPWPRT